MQLRSDNRSAAVTRSLLLLALSPGSRGWFWPGDGHLQLLPCRPCGTSRLLGLLPLPWRLRDAEKWLLSVFTLLCLAKALICRESARTCCQPADNIALIYMLFASLKFSIAAMDPFVLSLRFCFVLKILITFTNRQQVFFPILCCILELF